MLEPKIIRWAALLIFERKILCMIYERMNSWASQVVKMNDDRQTNQVFSKTEAEDKADKESDDLVDKYSRYIGTPK